MAPKFTGTKSIYLLTIFLTVVSSTAWSVDCVRVLGDDSSWNANGHCVYEESLAPRYGQNNVYDQQRGGVVDCGQRYEQCQQNGARGDVSQVMQCAEQLRACLCAMDPQSCLDTGN